MKLIISCEHGGNEVPPRFAPLFKQAQNVLNTHRGIDFGALELASALEKATKAPFFYSTVTRLLIEMNRSLHHPELFSEFSSPLSPEEKQELIQTYHHAYWGPIFQKVEELGDVFHLSMHSFTPVLNGVTREAEIGILYDPERLCEEKLAIQWKALFEKLLPSFRIRMNYPYLGTSDSLVTALRKKFFCPTYRGIELEVNQGLIETLSQWNAVKQAIIESVQAL